MGSVITLSVIGVITSFLISVLAGFPIQGASTTFDTSDESYSTEAIDETGRLFTENYKSLIDEIISYQKNPDYQRAEARRQDMVDLGNTLSGKFQGFQQRMEGDLNDLTAQQEELEAAAESETTQ